MLSDEQIRCFRERGYLKLTGVVAPSELEGLRDALDTLTGNVEALPEEWRVDFHYGGLFGEAIGKGEQLCRLEYSLQKDPRFLALLANPRLLEIPLSLHEGPFVLTWEDMVLKMPGGEDVPWHQDADHQSLQGPVFSIGIYLDSSHDDPLVVLPGTQVLGPLSEEEVATEAAKRLDQAVRVPVDPGDAIAHNVRMLHGSGRNTGTRPRRVIYFEFRTVEQVRHDSPWDESWLARRLPYVPLAIKVRRELGLFAGDDPRLVEEMEALRPEWFEQAERLDPASVDLRVHHEDLADAPY